MFQRDRILALDKRLNFFLKITHIVMYSLTLRFNFPLFDNSTSHKNYNIHSVTVNLSYKETKEPSSISG